MLLKTRLTRRTKRSDNQGRDRFLLAMRTETALSRLCFILCMPMHEFSRILYKMREFYYICCIKIKSTE